MDRGDPANREIASNAPGDVGAPTSVARLSDHDKMMTTTFILGQVADDRTKKVMVKISAVVDSGAEGKRAAREHDAVDSIEDLFSLKVKKDLPWRRGKIPLLREVRGR